MLETVEEYINRYDMIREGDLVVAGVSGGADSVCMLLQLYEYSKFVDYRLRVVHINHMIREDAPEDAAYVKNLCDERNIPFHYFEENVQEYAVKNGLSTEEAGRILRYADFEKILKEYGPDGKVAVAHNRNDVAETVMFNIFRGTGIEGLCSLTPVNGNIIRPLLGVTRESIEDYLREEETEYRTDSTNLANDYARNKIRNVLLPYADANICHNAIDHIADLSDRMCDIKEFIRGHVKEAYENTVTAASDRVTINLTGFNRLEPLLKQEVVLAALDNMTQGRKDIGGVHVNAILDLTGKSGEKRLDLPYDLECVKQYELLTIRKKQEQSENRFCVEVEPDSIIVLPNKARARISVIGRDYTREVIQKPYTKWFDYDKISSCLELRTRKSRDYLTINSDMGQKSLKDYLINEKVPREDRDEILVLADGNHVLWVVGYRISEYYKVTDETKSILEISIE